MKNTVKFEFLSLSENEALARSVAAAFIMPLDPTLEELADVRTAVSEAVTNAIVHGYKKKKGTVRMECRLDGRLLVISITDFGCGIENIEQARQPFFTTDADGERSGMGFAVMDDVDVVSRRDIGTRITLKKFFSESDYSAVCDGIADSKSDLHDENSENGSECISGRNTIEQTHGIIKAIRPSINVQNINARTSD